MRTIGNEEGKLTKPAMESAVGFEVVDLGPFDNSRNDLKAINDLGQAVGLSFNPHTGRMEALLEGQGRRTALGTLGGSFSVARAINNHGEIVGGSLTHGDEQFHGFLFRGNRLYDLNELLEPNTGWELIQAVGINNRGMIIGIGALHGEDRIVLLRPRRTGV